MQAAHECSSPQVPLTHKSVTGPAPLSARRLKQRATQLPSHLCQTSNSSITAQTDGAHCSRRPSDRSKQLKIGTDSQRCTGLNKQQSREAESSNMTFRHDSAKKLDTAQCCEIFEFQSSHVPRHKPSLHGNSPHSAGCTSSLSFLCAQGWAGLISQRGRVDQRPACGLSGCGSWLATRFRVLLPLQIFSVGQIEDRGWRVVFSRGCVSAELLATLSPTST
jgi:hypothetical protein